VSERVLEVLGYSFAGGAATSVLELAGHLPAEGFEVSIAAPPERGFAERTAAAGARFFPVPMEGRGDWRSFAKLVQLLRRERFDVVHTHCRNADLHGGLAAKAVRATSRSRRPRFVAHLRGFLVDGAGGTSRGLVDRVHRAFLERGPDRLIAVSEAVRRRALKLLRVPPERVATVLNGVDLERFAAPPAAVRSRVRASLGVPEREPLLLCVGTLGRCKGQDVLLHALGLLPDAVHAAFAGGGDALLELESLARRLGVAARVRFLGPREDVPELLASCDALVHPARWEGFGRAVAEAMAVGVPVVASAAGGLVELVQHEKSGLLVAPDRAGALAAAVRRLFDDRELAGRLALEARAFAREKLDARRVAREVAAALRDAIGASSGRPRAPAPGAAP
jgi:glycosyltransferase involved in cell wall biosynthesis